MDSGEPEWLALERNGAERPSRPYTLSDADEADDLAWWHLDRDRDTPAPEYGYRSSALVPAPRSAGHDALPLIEPPPAERTGRSRSRFRGPARHDDAGTRGGYRPPALAVALGWLDDHRYECAVVLGLVVALSVVGVVVNNALQGPAPVSTDDVGARGNSIPYTDPSPEAIDPGQVAPLPSVPAPSPVLPGPAPAPTDAAVPGAIPPQPNPGAVTTTAPGAPRTPPVAPPATGAKPPPVVVQPPPPVRGSRDAYRTIEAESYDQQQGTKMEGAEDRGGGRLVGFIVGGDWLRYQGVDFGSSPATQVRVRTASGVPDGFRGRVEVRLDGLNNAPIGSFSIGNTGGWQAWRTVTTEISRVTGVHTVFLTFSSDHPVEYVNVNWLSFAR